MVLASVIVAIILLGMHSAMLLASRANPDRNGRNSSWLQGGLGLDQMSADLSVATGFSAMTSTSVTFTVPDRNGDAAAETINYSWSGVAGARDSLFAPTSALTCFGSIRVIRCS